MKIYLIRHGETDWNTKRRLQGKTDIPLNANGEALAYETAANTADIPFDLIISSPLKRAYRTAEILRGNRQISILTDERIQEMCFGEFEGLICGGPEYNIPDPNFNNFFVDPANYKPCKGAESFRQLCDRTTEFLQELVHKEEYKDLTILVSTHGAALRGILSSLMITDLKDFWMDGVHKNCAITTLDVQGEQITVEAENQIFYDPAKGIDYYSPDKCGKM